MQIEYLGYTDTVGLGMAVVRLGGGRSHPSQVIDPAVGFSHILPAGSQVQQGDVLAHIYSPYSDFEVSVVATFSGIIIGRNNLPLINEGEALFHIAEVSELDEAEKTIDAISDEVDSAMPAVLGGEFGLV